MGVLKVECKYLTDYGNDCMIYKTVALLQVSGEYAVVILTKYDGQWGSNKITTETEQFKTLSEAKEYYNDIK
jgi:hypothetical protein